MTHERNDGKRLERLVEMLEGMHLPDGFKLTKNDKVYDDEGNQIAELDILIEGIIGSVTHRTLFECRDRPSSGAAPVSWIEQLWGRRDRLKLNAVIAVSTTGFAPAAVSFAKDRNIPLRSVDDLTEAEITGFLPKTAPLLETEANFSDVHVVAIPEDTPSNFESLPHATEIIQQTTFANTDKVFLNRQSGQALSMKELWHHVQHIQQADIFSDVPLDWQFVPKVVEARQDIKDQFQIVRDGYRGKIHKLTFTATVRHRWSPMPLVEAVTYSGDDTGRRVVARWTGGEGNAAEIVVILTKRQPD